MLFITPRIVDINGGNKRVVLVGHVDVSRGKEKVPDTFLYFLVYVSTLSFKLYLLASGSCPCQFGLRARPFSFGRRVNWIHLSI